MVEDEFGGVIFVNEPQIVVFEAPKFIRSKSWRYGLVVIDSKQLVATPM